ncbi:TRIM3 [Branchiostoma lanceolatum]|uniref:TRIM3 protein n=1 Tax=Branchiostoma lanceolatum TaxID=7740 RepID=A0A8K0A167_BRALA|nr:TRIM3 [Branchiostoma lanceolatum]CAH1266119.1 TRIM3 [Branchiostoma lanceolatum]
MFGQCLGQPQSRGVLRAPTVPKTPRSARSADGAQPVEADTHAYEDGDMFGQCLGQPQSRDVLRAPTVPKTPRPARRNDGSVGDQMDSPNQPPANGRLSIWEQLRHWYQGQGNVIIIIASVVMATLIISVPVHVLLVHTSSLPQHHDSPVTTTRGTDTAGDAPWRSSAVPRTVTSADVITVGQAHGRGPPDAVTAEVDAAEPTHVIRPLSTDTKAVEALAGVSTSADDITFCDESGAGKLRGANGVAVSVDNKIWVADRFQRRLQVYSIEGVYLCQFPPDAPGLRYPSQTPTDVSIDKDGHLWVLMIGYPASPDSVVQFSRKGHLKASFDLPDVPRGSLRGIAVGLHNTHVFVTWSDFYSGGMQAFKPDGKLLWDVSPQPELVAPTSVAVNGKGNIFVSDFNRHFIYVYDETGQFMSRFGGPGLTGGCLNHPSGITADRSGHIMVVDTQNQRVVMYTDRGEYVRAVRANHPLGIASGPGGQLVVTNRSTITVFPRF